jgi:hypothetical protein
MARSRIVSVAVVGLALGSALSFGASEASATVSPAETITANVSSGPFHIEVTASRPANSAVTAATGSFTAHFVLGSTTLFTIAGPVTCLDVVGHQAGLFYPITSSDPSLFAATDSGVFIYLDTDAHGKARSVGFLPVPLQKMKSCAPGLALLPVTAGTATLTP